MILTKLNQIRPDQTGIFTIPDLRFTSRGLQASDGGLFAKVGCRRKRCRRCRFATAVQDVVGHARCVFGCSQAVEGPGGLDARAQLVPCKWLDLNVR